MPIKGIFTRKENHENFESRIFMIEQKVKRINSLEVDMKRFLKMESRLQTLLLKRVESGHSNKPEGSPKNGTGQSRREAVIDESRIHSIVENMVAQEMARRFQEWDKHREQMMLFENELVEIKNQQKENERLIEMVMAELSSIKAEFSHQKQVNNHPFVYQDIKVDKLMIDKYELNNTISQLGVNQLSGTMNIGATYGTGMIPEDLKEDFKQNIAQLKKEKQTYEENKLDQNPASDEDTDEEATEIQID
jgi:hypothetical protein